MAFSKYKIIAIDKHDNVITTSDADTARYARIVARDWLGFPNVGSVRIWHNPFRSNVTLFEVYVNNGGKYCVIKDGIVKNIRV